MTSSALLFDQTHTRPTAEARPRPYSKAGLSPIAKLNCLALVGLIKLGLAALLFTHWGSAEDRSLETVLTVRTLADEQPPVPPAAPPEPSLPQLQPVVVSLPHFSLQAAAVTPPPSAAPAPIQAPAPLSAPPAPQADANPYYQLVLRQIAQHKRYPAQAKRIRQEGLVEISFEIGADGRLLSAQVSQSSQIQSLDAAALAAVTAASPFPPIPAELGVSRLSLSLPIEFALR